MCVCVHLPLSPNTCHSALALTLCACLHLQLSDIVYNGDEAVGYPGCVNLSFAYIEGESLLMALKDIALSSGR